MYYSTLSQKYGISRAKLYQMCRANKLRPIPYYSDYFLSESDGLIYYLKVDIETCEARFVVKDPLKKIGKHNFPKYSLKMDSNNEYHSLRLDKIYLYTRFWILPDSFIHYADHYVYMSGDLKYCHYTISDIKRIDDDTLEINNILFKRATIVPTLSLYISDHGVVYDSKANRFLRHHFGPKYYHLIVINNRGYSIHQLVYNSWISKEPIPEGYCIDHIDGYREHNNVDNLRLVTNLENSRNARFEQQLRSTPWSYEIIEFMCQQMEDSDVTGPTELLKRVKSKFPDFNVSYNTFKRKVYELKNGEFWKDLVAKYNTSIYDSNISNHRNAPCSDDLAIKICEYYLSKKYSTNKKLAEALETTDTMVNKILRGEHKRDITEKYGIVYSTKKRISFTPEEVHSISKDIMAGLSNSQLVTKYNRSISDIKKIICRKSHYNITRQYPFENVRKRAHYVKPYDPV